MKIYKFQIGKFKNLQDLTIQFDESKETFNNTVIVGENGSGKSNILEAIILIFRDLDLGMDQPPFKYKILYECRENMVDIDADPLRKRNLFNIMVNNKKLSYKKFKELRRELFLPNYLFGYYSGPSNRMESLFDIHQRKFYENLIKKERKEDENFRPLLYARHIHSQFALLSFFLESEDMPSKFLKDFLGIEGFDSALFVIKEPPWDSDDGDQRFWNARGSVQKLLSKLYELSLAPLKLKQKVQIDFRRKKTSEYLYLYIKDIDTLKELSGQYKSPQEFFKALESTYISKLISEVRIRLRVRTKNGSLTFSELSEGEQQLLMVLGLLKFTKEAESIFLLDEPDTHLNPSWSVSYLKILKDVLGEQKTSQLIMTTHDPLVISCLTRSKVIILRFDEKKGLFVAEHPENDPIKMGYPEILTSDIFKLKSIINPKIQDLLNQKRELSIKEHLNAEELKRLSELNEELDGFDFTEAVKDPLYEPFIRAMTEIKAEEKFCEPVLTKEQFDKRKQIAKEILLKVKSERSKSL